MAVLSKPWARHLTTGMLDNWATDLLAGKEADEEGVPPEEIEGLEPLPQKRTFRGVVSYEAEGAKTVVFGDLPPPPVTLPDGTLAKPKKEKKDASFARFDIVNRPTFIPRLEFKHDVGFENQNDELSFMLSTNWASSGDDMICRRIKDIKDVKAEHFPGVDLTRLDLDHSWEVTVPYELGDKSRIHAEGLFGDKIYGWAQKYVDRLKHMILSSHKHTMNIRFLCTGHDVNVLLAAFAETALGNEYENWTRQWFRNDNWAQGVKSWNRGELRGKADVPPRPAFSCTENMYTFDTIDSWATITASSTIMEQERIAAVCAEKERPARLFRLPDAVDNRVFLMQLNVDDQTQYADTIRFRFPKSHEDDPFWTAHHHDLPMQSSNYRYYMAKIPKTQTDKDDPNSDQIYLPSDFLARVPSLDESEAKDNAALRLWLESHPSNEVFDIKTSLIQQQEESRQYLNRIFDWMQPRQLKPEGLMYKAKLVKLLRAADFDHLPVHDVFESMTEDELKAAMDEHCKDLNDEKLALFQDTKASGTLRKTPGGHLVIDASPGTGKTELILRITAMLISYRNSRTLQKQRDDPDYKLSSTPWEHGTPYHKVVIASPTNVLCDKLATKCNDYFKAKGEKVMGRKIRVVRLHSFRTEQRILKHGEMKEQPDAIFTEEEFANNEMPAVMEMMEHLRKSIENQTPHGIPDKRLKMLPESLGWAILEMADSIPPALAPYSRNLFEPRPNDYGELKTYLQDMARGDPPQREQKTHFTNACTTAIQHILKMSDVIVGTTAALNTPKIQTTLQESKVDLLVLEEASRMHEEAAAGTIIGIQPRHVIQSGDYLQGTPFTTPDGRKYNNFNTQRRVALFMRLLAARIPHATLRTQRRMTSALASLHSKLGYNDSVLTDPRLDNCADAQKIQAAMKKIFNADKPYHWVDVEGSKAETIGANPSKFNEGEARALLGSLQQFVREGVACKDIAIVTPYKRQVDILKRGLAQLTAIPDIEDVRVDTCSALQGDEAKVVLISWVSTYNSRFLHDSALVNVAISRPQFGLVMFGKRQFFVDDAEKRSYIRKLAIRMNDDNAWSEVKPGAFDVSPHVRKDFPSKMNVEHDRVKSHAPPPCKNCGQVGHKAGSCPNPSKCTNCGEEGHTIRHCPHPPVDPCENCGAKGHWTTDCPLDNECRRCFREGHTALDCPGFCFLCRQEGHFIRNCKKPLTRAFCHYCGHEDHRDSQCVRKRLRDARIAKKNAPKTTKNETKNENEGDWGAEEVTTTNVDTSGWAADNGDNPWAGDAADTGNVETYSKVNPAPIKERIPNYYELLGFKNDEATNFDIANAYKLKSLEIDPGQHPAFADTYERYFRNLKTAYDILGVAPLRTEYNAGENIHWTWGSAMGYYDELRRVQKIEAGEGPDTTDKPADEPADKPAEASSQKARKQRLVEPPMSTEAILEAQIAELNKPPPTAAEVIDILRKQHAEEPDVMQYLIEEAEAKSSAEDIITRFTWHLAQIRSWRDLQPSKDVFAPGRFLGLPDISGARQLARYLREEVEDDEEDDVVPDLDQQKLITLAALVGRVPDLSGQPTDRFTPETCQYIFEHVLTEGLSDEEMAPGYFDERYGEECAKLSELHDEEIDALVRAMSQIPANIPPVTTVELAAEDDLAEDTGDNMGGVQIEGTEPATSGTDNVTETSQTDAAATEVQAAIVTTDTQPADPQPIDVHLADTQPTGNTSEPAGDASAPTGEVVVPTGTDTNTSQPEPVVDNAEE
ncbi:MAG: Tripartite DNA replication factor [Bogoriella megaspora]|nr:MAG: Tripartite DNA replication factor [Bogoriella megaspora]